MIIELFTPEELAKNPRSVIEYGFYSTTYGLVLLAFFNDKICHCTFLNFGHEENAVQELKNRWTECLLNKNDLTIRLMGEKIFSKNKSLIDTSDITVLLRGTPFQCAVWREVTKIPVGTTVSYKTIAESIKYPRASRAVGTALGHNQVALLVPCHRVIQKNGSLGNYRWGIEKKKWLLSTERLLITNKPSFRNTIPGSR